MNNCQAYFINMLNKYISKEINREQLYKWAHENLQKYLLDDFGIYIDNYTIYPFISRLAVNPTELESCRDIDIQKIKRILEGKESFTYCSYLRISKKVKAEKIDYIKEFINYYGQKGQIDGEFENLIDFLQRKKDNLEIITFIDLLLCQILNLLVSLPYKKGLEFNANALNFDIDSLHIDNILVQIKKLIKCYEGEQEFFTTINYNSNQAIVAILV